MAASPIIILDKRRVKKTDKFPVKLRVTYKGTSRDFQTIFDMTEEDFGKLDASHPGKELREIRDRLNALRTKAETICGEMRGFTFEKFEFELFGGKHCLRAKKKKQESYVMLDSQFDVEPYKKRFSILTEEHPDKDHISYTYSQYIQNLLKQDRIASALKYQDSYNRLKKFGGNVTFEEIDITYLVRFEHWMLGRGSSKTTVGILLRSLRAVFNEAIDKKIIRRDDCYPFGRKRYMLPTSRKVKKALPLNVVEKIFNYEPEMYKTRKAKAYWTFCYLGNGMNTKDMIHLKYKNIDGEYLTFERAKTERTSRGNPMPITVYLSEQMQAIISEWGDPDRDPENYIFPAMRKELNILEQYDLCTMIRTYINEGMEIIAKKLDIDQRVTNIVARHTFSTVLKRSGVSTEFIQESLGHTDKKTTENYLDSFEREMKKEVALKLTAFQPTKVVKMHKVS